MSRTWKDVVALLNDPFVDGDTKEHLLGAYINENYVLNRDEIPGEVREYLDSYSMQDGDYDQGSLDEVYERAQSQSEDRGYEHRQVEEELSGARSELDDMRPPAATGSDVATSDEIFELASPSLRVFETWLPINDEVPDDLVGRHGRISLEDIHTRFDEQLGINFRKFLEDADRIRQAHTALDEVNTTTERELTSLYQSWTGPAANASYDHYSRQLAPNASALLEALSASPGVIEAAVENVYQACKSKAEQVMELYTPVVGNAPPDIAETMVTLARYEEVSEDELKSVASWIDRQYGTELENAVNDGFVGAAGAWPALWDHSREWIRDSFNVDLHEHLYETFERVCDDTLEAVNTVYEELGAALGEYQNEFPDASTLQLAPPPGPSPDNGTNPAPGPGPAHLATGSAGSGSMPGPSEGGSTAGPVGAMPGIGAGPPPTPPPLDLPRPTPGPANTGALPADPQGTAPSTTAPPTPGADWSPVTSPSDAGRPETVTIDDGARKISMTSPDGQGTLAVTIDDGSGEPKTYQLQFGADAGPNGAAPVPSPSAEAVRADPNGVAVIEDGDLTITAERPADSPNQVMVTVDDGSGAPSTYAVDYADPKNPTVTTAEPASPGVAAVTDPGQYTAATAPSGGHSGEAGLATVADDAGRSSAPHGGGTGMPMMGATGAGGHGQERSASAWRAAGDLFDDDRPLARFRGVIGDG